MTGPEGGETSETYELRYARLIELSLEEATILLEERTTEYKDALYRYFGPESVPRSEMDDDDIIALKSSFCDSILLGMNREVQAEYISSIPGSETSNLTLSRIQMLVYDISILLANFGNTGVTLGNSSEFY